MQRVGAITANELVRSRITQQAVSSITTQHMLKPREAVTARRTTRQIAGKAYCHRASCISVGNKIITSVADQAVRTKPTKQRIGAITAHELVRSRITQQAVRTITTQRMLKPRQGIAACRTTRQIAGKAYCHRASRFGVGHKIITSAADQAVRAKAAIERIITAQPIKAFGTTSPIQPIGEFSHRRRDGQHGRNIQPTVA